MSFIPFAFRISLPVLLVVMLVAILLKYVLQFLFRLLNLSNYSTASPSGILSWTKLAPPDIVFRLASLGALNLVLYWLPIYYWATYTPSGDDRDGGVLFYSMAFCPVSWVFGGLCYTQVWRARQAVSPRYRLAFCIVSSLLLLLVFSTLIPQVLFYVKVSRL